MSEGLRILVECVAATVGTAAFALLFHVPGRYCGHSGLIGGSGWLCYRLFSVVGLSAAVATFFACMAVVFLSRLSAMLRRCPVTLFLVPGIFPLVPGAGIYWSAYYLVMNEAAEAGRYGGNTLKIAVAIVLGIVLILELPQPLFTRILKKRQHK